MFCPKCATQNIDGAKFCRSCGADISLVPQAMTGNMTVVQAQEVDDEDESYYRRRRGKRPSIEKAIRGTFTGLAFLFISVILSVSHMGRGWWFWMLIPAFTMIGGGIAEFVRAKQARAKLPASNARAQAAVPRTSFANELPPKGTSELMPPPPSVTEGTTRHLGAEGPTRVFSSTPERPKQKN